MIDEQSWTDLKRITWQKPNSAGQSAWREQNRLINRSLSVGVAFFCPIWARIVARLPQFRALGGGKGTLGRQAGGKSSGSNAPQPGKKRLTPGRHNTI